MDERGGVQEGQEGDRGQSQGTGQQLMQQGRRTTAPEAVEHDLPPQVCVCVCVCVLNVGVLGHVHVCDAAAAHAAGATHDSS